MTLSGSKYVDQQIRPPLASANPARPDIFILLKHIESRFLFCSGILDGWAGLKHDAMITLFTRDSFLIQFAQAPSQ
jgi:hypothetical protein